MKARGKGQLWIGYIRVSSKEQAESGLSLEAQESRIRAMATVKGVVLSEVISDQAESAKSLDRPGIQRILSLMNDGSVAGVIISKLDRLTRSVRDLGAIVDLLSVTGASIISCHETLDTSSASGRMILNITATIAQWEREVICERTQEALKQKLVRGEHAGNIAYGYRSSGEDGRAIPDEGEQVIISLIRAHSADGWSLSKIADWLNEQGYRTRRGTEWRVQYVHGILRRTK